ncbi:MAG: VWA domain-containing protein, partial [Phycisphaerales bacterium]|nr:VWA domain-containing protein [Phycisphaerales bacterium]
MTDPRDHTTDRIGGDASPPRDELDSLLREWHQANRERAAAGRDQLLAALARGGTDSGGASVNSPPTPHRHQRRLGANPDSSFRRLVMNRYSPLALAAMVALAVMISFLLPATVSPALASDNIVMCPEGGKLEALDQRGNFLGPCVLKHTDVSVAISGTLARVGIKQRYVNGHDVKIEAVYTFPMSHRSAVDRMTMTIGSRVVVGEVKERQQALAIYQAAREQGRVASLLEQERPNIFTQSIANIEPGAEVVIEISYVEVLEPSEGKYSFAFPMVVGPRYIPGQPRSLGDMPIPMPRPALDEPREMSVAPSPPPTWMPVRGVVLLAPANITLASDSAGPNSALALALDAAHRVEPPNDEAFWQKRQSQSPKEFIAAYPDGSKETGLIFDDGFGHVGGRCFVTNVTPGSNFAPPTDQVPDANRITPMPVRPNERAGHDISFTAMIDSGGAPIEALVSESHQIKTDVFAAEAGITTKARVQLQTGGAGGGSTIPNKDFVLSWNVAGQTVRETFLTHTGVHGNFFEFALQPPARIPSDLPVPRELIFVLDTSGSMNGYPIAKSKELMAKALGTMRPNDTFNIITFSGHTSILWPSPRTATPAARTEAMNFIDGHNGAGGTEMMAAIEAALKQTVRADTGPATSSFEQLLNTPADGREVALGIGTAYLSHWPPPNVRSTWSGLAATIGDSAPLAIELADH